MITKIAVVVTTLCFWNSVISQEENVVGTPLLTQLHLAKAKAMHDLAITRAKLHPTPHLLLETNPLYLREDSLLTPANYDDLVDSESSNSDGLNRKPVYSLKDLQARYYPHPIRYEFPEEYMSTFNARNKEFDQNTEKTNVESLQYDVQASAQEQATEYNLKIGGQNPALSLPNPRANKDKDLLDPNRSSSKFTESDTKKSNMHQEYLQLTNPAENNASADLREVKNYINLARYEPLFQDALSLNSDESLYLDLKTLEQSSSSDTEINGTSDKSSVQRIDEKNSFFEHNETVSSFPDENLSETEDELSSKVKTELHSLMNANPYSIGFLKGSTDSFEESYLKSAASNTNNARNLILENSGETGVNTEMIQRLNRSHPDDIRNISPNLEKYGSTSISKPSEEIVSTFLVPNAENKGISRTESKLENMENSTKYSFDSEKLQRRSSEPSQETVFTSETVLYVSTFRPNTENKDIHRTESKLENIESYTTDTSVFTETTESYPFEGTTEENAVENGDYQKKYNPKLNEESFVKILNDNVDLLSLLATPKHNSDISNVQHTPSIIQNFGKVEEYTKIPMQVLLPAESTTEKIGEEINPIVQDEFDSKRNMYLNRATDLPMHNNTKERFLGKENQNFEMSYGRSEPKSATDSENNEKINSTLLQNNNYNQQHAGNSKQYLQQIPATINQYQLRDSIEDNDKLNDLQRTTNYEIYSRRHNFSNRFKDEQLYLWNLNNIGNSRNTPELQFTKSISEYPALSKTQKRLGYEEPENNAYGHSFHRLKQYIKQIRDQDFNSYPRKYIQENHKNQEIQFEARENNNPAENNQTYSPELVSSYLLHFPINQAYFGERYRREIRNLNEKKSVGKEKRKQLPLISLIIDPYAKLDVPKTIKNFGTVTKNSLEDKKGPIYHFSNMLASMRNAALATLMIPPQDMLIPSDYKIINKKTFNNEIVSSPKSARNNDILGDNSLEKGGVFHKVGSIMRQSIESGQEALQHVNDVAQNARRIVSSTRQSLPRLLLPYAKVPEVTKARTNNKLTLITPRFADVSEDSTNHEDDYVKVGHVLDALSLSHPQRKEVGTMRITIQPKSKEPRLQSRFGETNESENPGYYVVKNHLEKNALNHEEVNEIIEIFHTIKEVAGAKSLKDFLNNVKTQLQNCTYDNNTIEPDNVGTEKVGNNLKFTKEMVEPFMGILKETSQEHRKKPKRAAPKRNYYDENAAFAHFLAGYEIVSSINPEVYKTYFHVPLTINHSADVNLKEIQHEIKNSKLLIVPPLLTSSQKEWENKNEKTFLKEDEGESKTR
ncbi:hypothetical protein Trydic_g3122 [Trypoxylus dichotomus]